MIAERLKKIKKCIDEVLHEQGGVNSKSPLKIIAVSKRQSVARIEEAMLSGLFQFAENYAQELEDKMSVLKDPSLVWHFIGSLQKNKVKKVVGKVEYIHSVHKLSLAQEISKQAQKIGFTQKILLQVNISEEASKSGFLKDELFFAVDEIQSYSHIQICGLMCMPALTEDEVKKRKEFNQIYALSNKIEKQLEKPHHMNELSMGTSHDYLLAIKEGATMIRLGTLLMGEREA